MPWFKNKSTFKTVLKISHDLQTATIKMHGKVLLVK